MRLPQRVPGAAHRLQHHAGARPVELAPQPAGVHVHDVGERVELLVPGALEDALAAEHLARVPQEELEQAELLGAQRERLPGEARLTRRRVEGERAEPRAAAAARAAGRRSSVRMRASSSSKAKGLTR